MHNAPHGLMMKHLRLFLVLCTLGTGLFAAAHAHASDAVEALRRSNERIHRFTLENGIVGLVKEDRSAPTVAIQLWFGTGSIHEDNYLGAGLSHYVEHMIFKGTPTRSTGDISRELDAAGGRVNAYTTLDRTVFHVVLPAANWKVGLDVLSDAVMNAAFPEDEWEREKNVILQEMAMGRDDPRRELSKLLWQTAYRVHPHRHPVIGHEDVFLQTTRDDLLAFFHRHYSPDNMMVALAGHVDAHEAEALVREAFAGFTRRARPPVMLPAEPPQQAPRTARKTGAYEVSRAVWGWHTVALHHPDAAALDVLAELVGGGDSARLPLELRDRQQLVHSISAWSFTPGQPGLFGISTEFDPQHEAAVIDAVEAEMARWLDTPFTEADIDKARRQVLVHTLTELQTARGQVQHIASGEFYAGDPRFGERYMERLTTVTPENLMEVLQRYLRPNNRTLALLTPPTTVTADREDEAAAPLIHEAVRLTLDNGIPLIVREDRRLPLVYVTVALLGGQLTESPGMEGITQFMSALLTRGTPNRSAQDIAETLESLGASLTAFSGQNSFGLQGMALAEDLDTLLSIMAECVQEAEFPETEINRQRARQLAELRAQRERPFTLADEMVRAILYPNHPYRWTPAGREDSVDRIDQAALRSQLAQHLLTGNMAISMFGYLSPAEAKALADTHFAALPPGERPAYVHRPEPLDLPAHAVQREPRQQTIYLMAFPGVDLADERVVALDILQTAMSGLSSNLGMEVREKRGLVYFVGAFQRIGLAPGRFVLYAGTYEDAVEEMEALFEAEIGRLVTEGPTPEELARAQEQLVGDFYSVLQDNAALAQLSALNELYGLGYAYAFAKEQRVREVTGEDVRRAAASVLQPEQRVVSIVFPSATEGAEPAP